MNAPFAGNISQRFSHVGEQISLDSALVPLIYTKHFDVKVAAPISIALFYNEAVK